MLLLTPNSISGKILCRVRDDGVAEILEGLKHNTTLTNLQ
jgi:hypothetical protein